MRQTSGRDLVHRFEKNPIIELEDLSFSCLNIMNAGAVKAGNQYILLVRIETMRGHSVIFVARSTNGMNFVLDKVPILGPATEGKFQKYEGHGVADPRITYLEGVYYIVYTALSRNGKRLVLAKTSDFQTIEKLGLISEPDNHNGALFSRKINDCYVRLERPFEGGNIWISYSKDLYYWGRSSVVMSPRGPGFWDESRVGCAVPPLEVEEGWLLIYYGVKETSGGPLFRLGVAMLDKEDPSRLIGRASFPILSPRESYERVGDHGNMVFSCGAIVENKEIMLYYGGADMGINLGTVLLSELVEECLGGEGRENGSF